MYAAVTFSNHTYWSYRLAASIALARELPGRLHASFRQCDSTVPEEKNIECPSSLVVAPHELACEHPDRNRGGL